VAAKFEIELGPGFVSKTRSLDQQIRQALVDVIGDNMTVDQTKSKRRLGKSFRTLLEQSVTELKAETPKDTGKLAAGWELKTKRTNGQLEYLITNDNNKVLGDSGTLLDVLEFGARPHTIKPRYAQALAFFWQRMGKNVFFRQVRHPGINKSKNPFVGFIGRARRRLRKRGTKQLESLGKRIIADVQRG